jgi:5-(carboxyamino)imidazole ribonucleotide synthase
VTENRHRTASSTSACSRPRAETIRDDARKIALRIADALDLVGLLGVEMFVDRDGQVLVNEIAPRPHNSGHWTMDACPVDQFAMHVRAVTGSARVAARRPASDAAMKNLIGPDDMALWPAILATRPAAASLRQVEARPGRKMGHVNFLFPAGALPGEFGVDAALGPLAEGWVAGRTTPPAKAPACGKSPKSPTFRRR